MEGRLFLLTGVLSLGLLLPGRLAAQMPERDPQAPTPGKAPGTIPPQRSIFVPVWTEPTTSGAALPSTTRRERVDFLWTGVPLPAGGVEPSLQPEGARAALLELRRSSPPAPQGDRPQLAVLIRLQPARKGARPYLEVVDGATLLHSGGWGRQIRRAGSSADWLFVVPDPLPPVPGAPNPISARVDLRSLPNRTFELRLVSNVPAGP